MAKQKQQTPRDDLVYIRPEDIDPNESHNNKHCCLDPIRFVDEKLCNDCFYESKCVYVKKYQYYKP